MSNSPLHRQAVSSHFRIFHTVSKGTISVSNVIAIEIGLETRREISYQERLNGIPG